MSKFAYAALSCAALSVVVSAPSRAQETAITAGGDVTAEEVTPLPPVVVEAPSQPLARKTAKKKSTSGSGASTAQAAPATDEVSGEGVAGEGVGVYTLGQLDLIGGSVITNEAMWSFNKNTLEAAVSIMPGVTVHSTGGSRNEKDIFVRGFDRFRVPLYMDGVRIYLPYDNRLDFNRFLTPDLSEIQVQKGYVSVLNGPGGMGGAINLVSRKPTKEVELEGRVGAVLDGDLGSIGQWNAYAFGGTRQKGYYAQVSGTIVDQDHFDMSSDFTAANPATTPGYVTGFPYEDGGNRDRSGFEDWRINAKVGITPNATDEYSINYTVQQANKESPLHTRRQVVQGYFSGAFPRHWYWPQWDVSTLSWLSKTQIGDASYVKTNAYYNTFDNTLFFHRDATYTTRISDSIYADDSMGGFVEFGTELIPMNTLKGAIHYRRDIHDSWGLSYEAGGAFTGRDPTETNSEETWSFAVENTFHAARNLDIVAGVSYDRNKVLTAEFWNDDDDNNQFMDEHDKPTVDAWNWQTAAILDYSRTGTAHASISSRTRFPTLFDRYSTRFDARNVNPDLKPERATNYEIGVSETLAKGLQLSGAIFYSDIEDSIQNAFFGANGNNSIVGFNADGENYGFELSATWQASPTLRIGGNYTYLERNLDFASAAQSITLPNAQQQAAARGSVAASQIEGTPRHEAFVYLSWQATRKLTLTPNVQLASDRSALITDCNSTLPRQASAGNPQDPASPQLHGFCPVAGLAPNTASARPNYTQIGSYAVLNLQADYEFTENFTTAFGITNLLDQNYSLADGFPEAGRQFFVTARAKF